VRAVFLGTGTIYPDPERRSPGVALVCGNVVLVFDSGPGTWFRLSEAGLDFREVSALFYSHVHLDHILDYPAYLFLTHNPDFGRAGELMVYAPPEFEAFDRAFKELFGNWLKPHGVSVNLELVPKVEHRFEHRGIKITSTPVTHHESSLAYRVDYGGRSFVYGGDTACPGGELEACKAIIKLARAADLLVLESAFPESDPHEGHLHPSLAGRIAQEAGVKRLALTHFYPACKGEDMEAPAREVFEGEVIAAADLMRIEA